MVLVVEAFGSENEVKGVSVMRNLHMLCYVVIYLRFVRDRSVLNMLLVYIALSLAGFLKDLLVSYLHRQLETMRDGESYRRNSNDGNGLLETEVIRTILIKSVRYLQILIVAEALYCVMYHGYSGSPLFYYDSPGKVGDVVEPAFHYKYGYFIMNLIREEMPYMSSRWKLLAIDVVLLILQLVVITKSLEPELDGIKLIIPELRTHQLGMASILLFNTTSSQDSSRLITLCTCQEPDRCEHNTSPSALPRTERRSYGAT